MIYRLSRDLSDLLVERGFPAPVVYGPERLSHVVQGPTTVVVERDRQRGDAFETVKGQQRNTHRVGTRQIGVKITILAQSALAGARVQDHEALADQYVDAVQAALYRWATAGRSAVLILGGRFLRGEELGGLEVFAGVVYEMQLSIARGVEDRDYEGAGLAVGLIAAVATTRTVTGTAPL